jgi:hypothetical protein
MEAHMPLRSHKEKHDVDSDEFYEREASFEGLNGGDMRNIF